MTTPTPWWRSGCRRWTASPRSRVNGAEQPAIRIRVNPVALDSMGLSMEDVRTAVANANAAGPLGAFDGDDRAVTIATTTSCAPPRNTSRW